MPEHRIRLRGGWDVAVGSGQPGPSGRVALPTTWPPGSEGTVRLVRRFGRPPTGPTLAAPTLEMLDVPGLVCADLNGVELAGAGVEVVALADRNVLMLEVDLGRAGGPGPWGSISLVIAEAPAGGVGSGAELR